MRGTGRELVPDASERAAITSRLNSHIGQITTKVVEAMEARHPWFMQMGADDRSWITLVARAGIDNFVEWFNDDSSDTADPRKLFNAAPRALTRKVSLHQTVDLVRTTIDVVGEQISVLMPRSDQWSLELAVVHFSREVAFAAAEIYARAAELRGGWDERMEALIVDAIVRAEADDLVVSRASALGWHSLGAISVIAGPKPLSPDLDNLRTTAGELGLSVLVSEQGGRLVVIASGAQLTSDNAVVGVVDKLSGYFGPGTIVVGPLVDDLTDAARSAQETLSASRAAHAWPESPRVVSSRALLPERVLAGHPHARHILVDEVYRPLATAGGELLHTATAFLDRGCSVEATARELFVHPNTVRYRLKRIGEVTGMVPSDPRQAYVLHLAITLGRLSDPLAGDAEATREIEAISR